MSEVFYPIEIHFIQDNNNKYFFVFNPDFGYSTCSATGDSIIEALQNLDKVRKEIIDYFISIGKEVPVPKDITKLIPMKG